MNERRLTLHDNGATAWFDLDQGGRLGGLTIDGVELLVDADHDPMRWGSYPMAPWAGRIRHGRFRFHGIDHRLPINLAPHAIHGTAYTSAWTADGQGAMSLELGSPWPFAGRLSQQATLSGDELRITLRLHAGDEQPAMLGWHPWFRRRLGDDGPEGEVELDVQPGRMYELGEAMIPTGRLIEPTDPPWDNCFVELAAAPRLTWPGRLVLTVDSDCTHWTIFTEPEHAVCVEPQTEAPDVFNRDPSVVSAGSTLEATMTIRWQRLS